MGKNQYGEYVTDEKFIEVWNQLKSPTAVAKELGINIRNAMMRRRTLEVKYDIVLDTDLSYKNKVVAEYKERERAKRKEREDALQERLDATSHSVRRGMELEKGRIIIFSDAHFTDYTTTAFKALIKFIEHFKPKAIICNGDAFDGAVLSRFPKINYDSQPSVLDELNY